MMLTRFHDNQVSAHTFVLYIEEQQLQADFVRNVPVASYLPPSWV